MITIYVVMYAKGFFYTVFSGLRCFLYVYDDFYYKKG